MTSGFSRTMVVADARAGLRVAGLTLLERALHEVSLCSASGVLPARLEIRSVDPERRRRTTVPAGLQPEWIGGEEAPAADAHTLIISAWVLMTHGGLRAWLLAGTPADALPAAAAPGRQASPCRSSFGAALVVRDRRDLPAAREMLLSSLGRASDGLAARLVNRKISRRVTAGLVPLGVSPNMWTALLGPLLIGGAAAMLRGDAVGLLAGVLLFNAQSILDGCDGELARLMYRNSPGGSRLDTASDMAAHVIFAAALGFGLARYEGSDAGWRGMFAIEGAIVAAATAAVSLGVARDFGRDGHLNDFGGAVAAEIPVSGRWAALARGIVLLTKQDTYNWLWVVLAALSQFQAILHLLAAGVALHVLALLGMRMRAAARVQRSVAR